jgi:hypothetical protein
VRAQTLPAAAGLQWIFGGLAIYRRSPLVLSLLGLCYWFTVLFLILLLNAAPVIGVILSSLTIPGLSVGFMQAARNVERGQPAGLPTLFGGLRENARTLFLLGILYFTVYLGVLGLSSLVDGGDFLRYLTATSRAERAALEDADFTLALLFIAVLMTPVLMAWWFAPVLAAWHRLSLAKSLFFSFVACQMNWQPFLVFVLGLTLFAGVLPGVLLGVLVAIVPAAKGILGTLILAAMVLVFAPVIYASFYAGYRDIFGISEIV